LQATILDAAKDDWMEFQAAYASCAILMPKSLVLKESERLLVDPCIQERAIVEHLAALFDVSNEAAKWRVSQLGLLRAVRALRQTKLPI
jgi:Zn-dependent peptidase ImmA (M78 family)